MIMKVCTITDMRKLAFLTILCLTITACGGSGGGGRDSFAGTWLLNLSLREDTCNVVDFLLRRPVYLINDDGNNIAAENLESSAVFTGGVIDDGNGFVATDVSNSGGCNVTSSLIFTNRSGDFADARFDIQASCNDGSLCSASFRGSAERQ